MSEVGQNIDSTLSIMWSAFVTNYWQLFLKNNLSTNTRQLEINQRIWSDVQENLNNQRMLGLSDVV